MLLTAEHVRSAGSLYAGSLGAVHPAVSPIFGNLAGLPTLHVFAGGRELLRPSMEEFAERAIAAGTDVRLGVGEGQQHTWPAAPTPEGRRARRRIVELIGSCR